MRFDPSRALFHFGVGFVIFTSGVVTTWADVFPSTLLRRALLAAGALVEAFTGDDDAKYATYSPDLDGPTVLRDDARAGSEHILVSGGKGYLPLESSTGSAVAWLMDRRAHIEHVWTYDPATWSSLERVRSAPLTSEVYAVGLHLYEDGGLLVNFQGRNTWPYGVGLARYDRDSRLLWKKELFIHHWFTVAPDGRIYAASQRMVRAPVGIGGTAGRIASPDGMVSDDRILILDPDGNVLDEISMLDALVASGYIGLFQGATEMNLDAQTSDPTHLNDVRVVDEALARRYPLLKAGDMLVSFRSLNAVGILDGLTKRFKWLSAGKTVRQHSPRFFGNGLLLLDNHGGPAKSGGSRLVTIDFDTRRATTVFPRPDARPLPRPFFTDVAGYLDVAGSSRVLVSLTTQGEVWEIDLEKGDVLWQYAYVDPATHRRLPIYTAAYVPAVTFPTNRHKE